MKHFRFLRHYKQYRHKIYTYFYYRVGLEQSLAEDLTSDVFLKAYEAYDRYDPSRSFQAWVYRIAHNRLVNHYRDNKKHLSVDELLDADLPTVDGFERITRSLKASELMHLLDSLSEQDRYLLTLKYLDQLSYAEMAEILERSAGALRVAVNRAKAKLIKHVKEKMPQ